MTAQALLDRFGPREAMHARSRWRPGDGQAQNARGEPDVAALVAKLKDEANVI